MIGIDAGCLNILLPWIEQGKLPNIARLMNTGSYGDLRSVIPDVTPPAWTSLITGRNPGKHGITCEFFKQSNSGDQKEIVSALDNKSKCIWDYLSENGMSSIVINVPVTHPARKMNGVIIPGYLAPPDPVCYPGNALEKLRDQIGAYHIYSKSEVHEESPENTLRDFMNLTMMRKEAALYFASKYNWDFLMVEFQKTDGIFHVLPNESHDAMRLQLYQCVDSCIGEMLESIGKGANVFLASDHGIGKCKWSCCIDTWLHDRGWLKYKNKESSQAETLLQHKKKAMSKEKHSSGSVETGATEKIVSWFSSLLSLMGKMGITIETMEKIAGKLHLEFLGKRVPKSIRLKLPRRQIEWENTKAFCPSPRNGIRINLKGREACGLVNPENEYDDLRNQIVAELASLKNPDGQPVFDWVGIREDYYHGDKIESAPDILFVPNDSDPGVTFHSTGVLFRSIESFGHKMDGFVVANGPDMKTNGLLPSNASILDIAPTVLHSLGLPIPKDMDGRVLTELFNAEPESGNNSPQYYDEVVVDKFRAKVRRLKKSRKL